MAITGNKNICEYNKYTINSVKLDSVIEFKDLGIVIRNKFTFSTHISFITNECNRKLYLVMRVAREFNIDTVKLLYFAFVRSKIEYGSIVWSPQAQYLTNNIEKVQKKFLRCMFFKKFKYYPFKVSYITQLNSFNFISLETRRNVYVINYIRSILQGEVLLPDILEHISIREPNINLRKRSITFEVKNSSVVFINKCLKTANTFLQIHVSFDIYIMPKKDLIKYTKDM